MPSIPSVSAAIAYRSIAWTTTLAVYTVLAIGVILLWGLLHRIAIHVIGVAWSAGTGEECYHKKFEMVLKRAQRTVSLEKGFKLSEFCDAVVSDRCVESSELHLK